MAAKLVSVNCSRQPVEFKVGQLKEVLVVEFEEMEALYGDRGGIATVAVLDPAPEDLVAFDRVDAEGGEVGRGVRLGLSGEDGLTCSDGHVELASMLIRGGCKGSRKVKIRTGAPTCSLAESEYSV